MAKVIPVVAATIDLQTNEKALQGVKHANITIVENSKAHIPRSESCHANDLKFKGRSSVNKEISLRKLNSELRPSSGPETPLAKIPFKNLDTGEVKGFDPYQVDVPDTFH